MKSDAHGSTFNSYAAGKRRYGGGRSFPNQGAVSATGKIGYTMRDAQIEALKRRLGG